MQQKKKQQSSTIHTDVLTESNFQGTLLSEKSGIHQSVYVYITICEKVTYRDTYMFIYASLFLEEH